MAKAATKAHKKMTKEERKDCTVCTPIGRVSFPHVFQASGMPGVDKKKFSITLLFKKTQDLSSIKKTLKNAKIMAFGPKEKNWPEDLEMPIRDGDHKDFKDYEGYKGHWVVKASSNEEFRPGVVDEDGQPILDQADFYAGCYARAILFARVWEFGNKQGVQFILDHAQKMKDGKPFGNRKSAEAAFAEYGIEEADGEDEEPIDDEEEESSRSSRDEEDEDQENAKW